eukprot:7799795-Ditylum_brightwellii.AAC.1
MSNKIYVKVQKLAEDLSNNTAPILLAIERYESVTLITEFMLSTEKKCRRTNPGYAWNNLPDTEYLYELEASLNIQQQHSMPIKQLQSRLCNA